MISRRHGTGRLASHATIGIVAADWPGSATRRVRRTLAVRVGILTGGGDCPGLNAVIRAIVRKGERVHGDELVGFLDAWDGVRERRTMPLTIESMRGTLPQGGTVLGTKRGSPFDTPAGVDEVRPTRSPTWASTR